LLTFTRMDFLNNLFTPYQTYSSLQIGLEILATFTGILSVIFAIFKRIWVYPVGIVSTVLYTYLLYEWGLYGDMLINGYYTIMSLYGWWAWMQVSFDKKGNEQKKEFVMTQMISCLFGGFVLVMAIYYVKFDSLQNIPFINWLDAICTSLFLVAMFLMAQKRIENWYFWIVGNTLAIYLFYTKGYTITSIQYVIFLILAIIGLDKWRKSPLKI
jgi:nicotinamide mononucleotide transporter